MQHSWWSLCYSNSAWDPFQLSKSCFFLAAWRVFTETIRLGYDEFFSFFFFFSHFLEIHAYPFKNQLCHPVCDFIDFGLLLIILYLAFNAFWIFFFNFIIKYFIQFDFLSDLITLLLIALFLYFILFLIIIYLQFSPFWLSCICFVNSFLVLILLISILLSFSWFIYIFFNLTPQYLISFDFLSSFGPLFFNYFF